MAKDTDQKSSVKVKQFFKKNWGAPFFAGFVVLLMMLAASSFSMQVAAIINKVAVAAFVTLAVAVILQFFSSLAYGTQSGSDGQA